MIDEVQPRLTGSEVFAVAVTFTVVIAFYFVIWLLARWLGRTIAQHDNGRKKRLLTWIQSRLGWVVLTYSLIVMVAIPALFYTVYEDRLLEGLISSIALLWFLRTQMPSLFPPVVDVFFHHWDDGGHKYDEPATETDRVQGSAETFLITRVVNTGLATYQACSCSITFPTDVTVIPFTPLAGGDERPYGDVDFAKPFHVQRQNNAVRFPVDSSHVIYPGDSIFYPVRIRTPDSQATARITVEFGSTTAWAQVAFTRTVTVG